MPKRGRLRSSWRSSRMVIPLREPFSEHLLPGITLNRPSTHVRTRPYPRVGADIYHDWVTSFYFESNRMLGLLTGQCIGKGATITMLHDRDSTICRQSSIQASGFTKEKTYPLTFALPRDNNICYAKNDIFVPLKGFKSDLSFPHTV